MVCFVKQAVVQTLKKASDGGGLLSRLQMHAIVVPPFVRRSQKGNSLSRAKKRREDRSEEKEFSVAKSCRDPAVQDHRGSPLKHEEKGKGGKEMKDVISQHRSD